MAGFIGKTVIHPNQIEVVNRLYKVNKKDIEEIPAIYLKGVEFHYVENVQDVWAFALTDETVAQPINLTTEPQPEEQASFNKTLST